MSEILKLPKGKTGLMMSYERIQQANKSPAIKTQKVAVKAYKNVLGNEMPSAIKPAKDVCEPNYPLKSYVSSHT